MKCCVTGLIRGRLNRDQSWGYVSENACQLVKRRKSSGFTTRGFSEMPLTLSSAELPLFFFWHFCNLCLLSVFLYLLFFNEIMKSTDTGPFSSLVFLGPPATVISLKHPQPLLRSSQPFYHSIQALRGDWQNWQIHIRALCALIKLLSDFRRHLNMNVCWLTPIRHFLISPVSTSSTSSCMDWTKWKVKENYYAARMCFSSVMCSELSAVQNHAPHP